MLLVFTTCPNIQEADSLAERIVDLRLAACVQIMPMMTSVYIWEGKLQREPEHLLLIKTLPEKWDELQSLIVKYHSYSVPEIVAIDADRISTPYLKWMQEMLET
ncbi:divalent-cation tolerance protein CutA [soil metagenome]